MVWVRIESIGGHVANEHIRIQQGAGITVFSSPLEYRTIFFYLPSFEQSLPTIRCFSLSRFPRIYRRVRMMRRDGNQLARNNLAGSARAQGSPLKKSPSRVGRSRGNP